MHHSNSKQAGRWQGCRSVTARWPELFVGLTPGQRRLVVLKLDEADTGGQTPTRDEVDDMVQYVVGEITQAEYVQRRSQGQVNTTEAVAP